MDVSVTVGLHEQPVGFFEREMGGDVRERGDKLLAEERDLAVFEPEIFICGERGDRPLVRLFARHDHQRDPVSELLRSRADDSREVGEVGGVPGDFDRDIELDSVVSEALSEPPCHKNDSRPRKHGQPGGLGFQIVLPESRKVHDVRLLRRAALVGVAPGGGIGQERARIFYVALQAARIRLVGGQQAFQKLPFFVIADARFVPARVEMALVFGDEAFSELPVPRREEVPVCMESFESGGAGGGR